MSRHRAQRVRPLTKTRMFLCAIGWHDYDDVEVDGEPYTYRCRYCPETEVGGYA